MADPISNVAGKQISQNMAGAEQRQNIQQSQNGNRSFENILQNGGNQSLQQTANNQIQSPNITNDKRLDGMRLDLMQRYDSLPDGVPKTTAVLPEFLDTKTRMSAFRDILNNAVGSVNKSPQSADVKGSFSNVENEWFQLEKFMRSDKELSQGELLGLQARLYQVSQHIDVLSKVVDQMTGGVKTVLNTNV